MTEAVLRSGRCLALLGIAAGFLGCRPDPRPSYSEDVHPIFAAHCLRCHASGGAMGIELNDYRAAVSAQFHLEHVMKDRVMPPWGTDNSGQCGTWANARWLTSEDRATVLNWIAEGTPEGDLRRLQPFVAEQPPSPREGAIELAIGTTYTPGPGPGTQRCFVVDPQLSTDGFLKSLAVDFPASKVARVALFALDSAEAESRARDLDAADAGPGYRCAGSSGVIEARFLLGVTRASSLMLLPDESGVHLAAGMKLIAQLDYDLLQSAPSKGAMVYLKVAAHAPEGRWTEIRAPTLSLPPGMPDATAEATYVSSAAMAVRGVYPQMRLLGTRMELAVEQPEVGTRCLLSQFDWNLHLLREPRLYESPQELATPSRFTLTCHYDTRSRSEPVYNGETLEHEECALLLYTVDAGP